MCRVTNGSTRNLPDVQEFLDTLNVLKECPVPAARDLFDPAAELVVTRAPGRLDVMGGIADYSGSLVLQLPIREATFAALQRSPDRTLRIVSLGAKDNSREPDFEMPLADFEKDGPPVPYEKARAYFQRDSARRWAAYAAGAFLVLMRENGIEFTCGARILIGSNVPEGKGVSSSAAVEVAVMQAVAAAFDVTLDPRELAILCQKVENLVVGAPCGVMDQMTASCGCVNRMLALLCQPAELQPPVDIPEGIEFWGLDSGVRHSVSGADYSSVRIGAFMGYRIIAELAGLTVHPAATPDNSLSQDPCGTGFQPVGSQGLGIGCQPLSIDDHLWHGCLANVTPSFYEEHFSAHLPERMTGRDFLIHYGGITDHVTRIDPQRDYAVRNPAAHPIYEHFRVRAFAELLTGLARRPTADKEPRASARAVSSTPATRPNEPRMELLGELMYQSHASYSACGLGCDGTDRLVELVRLAGPPRGLYGAKITGGGSGGTVAALARKGSEPAIREIARAYAHETGHDPYVFSGSSPGAHDFGQLTLRPDSTST